MPRCLAKNCYNRSEKKTYFQFPNPKRSAKDKKLCKLWIDKLMNDELDIKTFKHSSSKVVCEDHFEPDCFEGAYINDVARSVGFFSTKRLKPGSFPTRVNAGVEIVFRAGRKSAAALLERTQKEQIIHQLKADDVERKFLCTLGQSTSNEEGRTNPTSAIFLTPEALQVADNGVEANPVTVWQNSICVVSGSKQILSETSAQTTTSSNDNSQLQAPMDLDSEIDKTLTQTPEATKTPKKNPGIFSRERPLAPTELKSLGASDFLKKLAQQVEMTPPPQKQKMEETNSLLTNETNSPLAYETNSHLANETNNPLAYETNTQLANETNNGQSRTYRLISPLPSRQLPEECPCLQPLSCHCVPLEDEEEADLQMWIKKEDFITESQPPVCCEDIMAGQEKKQFPSTDKNLDNSDLRYSRNRRWLLKKTRFLWLRNDHTYMIHPDLEFRKEDKDLTPDMGSPQYANTLSPDGSSTKSTDSNEDWNSAEHAYDENLQMLSHISEKSLAHDDNGIVNNEQFEVYMDIAEDDYFEFVPSHNSSTTSVSQIKHEKQGDETAMDSDHNSDDESSSLLSNDIEPNVSNMSDFLDDQTGQLIVSHVGFDKVSDKDVIKCQKDFLTLVDDVKRELDSEFVVYATSERLSIMLMQSHRPCATIKLSIEISCDFKCEVFVQQKPLHKTHVIWNNLPSDFRDFVSILKLCKRVKQYEICRGNIYEKLRSSDNGPSVHENIDFRNQREKSTENTETFRPEQCSLLTILERCPHCQALFDGRLKMGESPSQKKHVFNKYYHHPDHEHCNTTIEKLVRKISQQNIDIHIMQEELLMGK